MTGIGRLLAVGVLAAVVPLDLDVEIPGGSPFDQIKIPKESPKPVPTSAGKPETPTSAGTPRPEPGSSTGVGKTVAEDPKKAPPPRPPTGLPGVAAPTTLDYANHLGWKPKDEIVEWKDPTKPDVATGSPANVPAFPEKWDVKFYPPQVPNDLYVYAVTRFLMAMIHPQMVSERELTQFLIEIDYPAHYAATAVKAESRLKRMSAAVLEAVGPMVKTPPGKPATEVAQKVYMDLISRYCYEPGFGQWILSQPTETTLPVLLDIVKNHKHPFLVRNAAFILRCYNVPEIVPVLRDLLIRTKDKVVRNRALAALVRWQDDGIVDWLCKQAGGPDVSFRNLAVWALGRIGAPSAIEPLAALVRQNAGDGEFLWTAIPALAYLGEAASPEGRQAAEDALAALGRTIEAVACPPPWSAGADMTPPQPDPPNGFVKVLAQRLRIALARLGRASEVQLVKKMGYGEVLKPNLEFYSDTFRKLK